MRPTFEVRLAEGACVRFFDALRAELDGGTSGYVGQIVPGHAVIHQPPGQRTMLSPFLALDWDAEECVLHGRFSPHPNVWMGFIAIYCLLGLIGVGGAMYGAAEWTLGNAHWSLWLLPASLAAIAFVYGAAVIGQGLTADDMYALRAFVDATAARATADHGSGE